MFKICTDIYFGLCWTNWRAKVSITALLVKPHWQGSIQIFQLWLSFYHCLNISDRFFNLAPHFIRIQIFQIIPWETKWIFLASLCFISHAIATFVKQPTKKKGWTEGRVTFNFVTFSFLTFSFGQSAFVTISFCDNQLLWQSASVTFSFLWQSASVTISFCDNQLFMTFSFLWQSAFVTISFCDNQLFMTYSFQWQSAFVTISFSWHSAFCDF